MERIDGIDTGDGIDSGGAAEPAIAAVPIATEIAAALRAGAPDANAMAAERRVSDGVGTPCRHCLKDVPAGREMLVLAHRPFSGRGPYAETGPIFLCADPCPAWAGDGPPPILATSPRYAIRGYDRAERIVAGTGGIVAAGTLWQRAAEILAGGAVAVHVRSASHGCFQCAIIAREAALGRGREGLGRHR